MAFIVVVRVSQVDGKTHNGYTHLDLGAPHMPSQQSPLISPVLLEQHAYQVAHLISSFTVPLMSDLYRIFDGDMVEMLVLGEIGTHNVSQFFNKYPSTMPEQWLDDESRRYHFMRPCNALSISDATGIPRETVRRKVNQLIQKGWLYRDGHNNLILTAGMGQGFIESNAQRVLQLLQLADTLRALLQVASSSDD